MKQALQFLFHIAAFLIMNSFLVPTIAQEQNPKEDLLIFFLLFFSADQSRGDHLTEKYTV
jgi:hypothetical protein